MPDLESFIISAKNQEDLKSGIQRKKKKKSEEEDDEDDFTEELSLIKSSGTRTRPGANQIPNNKKEEVKSEVIESSSIAKK
jgi:hypothetical protein